jgi:hypothetical protein
MSIKFDGRYGSAQRRDMRAVGADRRGIVPELKVVARKDRRVCPKGGVHEPVLWFVGERTYRTRSAKGKPMLCHSERWDWRCHRCHTWGLDPRLIPFSSKMCSSEQLSHWLESKWCGGGHLFDTWDIDMYYSWGRWVRGRLVADEKVVACVMCGRAKSGGRRYGIMDMALLRASGIGEAGILRIVKEGTPHGWSESLGRTWYERLGDTQVQ